MVSYLIPPAQNLLLLVLNTGQNFLHHPHVAVVCCHVQGCAALLPNHNHNREGFGVRVRVRLTLT